MDIAALLPTSLIDFPHTLAAVLFAAGCNFRCPFCHNPELVHPDRVRQIEFIPEKSVLTTLQERQGFLDGIVITGGEPTIHPDLAAFIERVKSLGYRVKLDTNGSRPEVLAALLDAGLLDYVAMDLKAPPSHYSELAGVPVDMGAIKEAIHLVREKAPEYEFRTTVAPTMTRQDVEEMVAFIGGAKSYWLQQFVVPDGKGLVDPAWRTKTALSEKDLRAVWGGIEGSFDGGGVR